MILLKIIVLGCGKIGSTIARVMSSSLEGLELAIADLNLKKFKEGPFFVQGTEEIQLDATNYEGLVKTLRDFDVAIDALPGRLGFKVMRAVSR